jgi:D-lyxose ketol-isomerase
MNAKGFLPKSSFISMHYHRSEIKEITDRRQNTVMCRYVDSTVDVPTASSGIFHMESEVYPGKAPVVQ